MLVRWIDPLRTAFAVTLVVALVWAMLNLSLVTGARLTSSLCAYAMLWVSHRHLCSLRCFPLLPLIADYCRKIAMSLATRSGITGPQRHRMICPRSFNCARFRD